LFGWDRDLMTVQYRTSH